MEVGNSFWKERRVRRKERCVNVILVISPEQISLTKNMRWFIETMSGLISMKLKTKER